MTARTTGATRLTIGFIPLADAAALIVGADRGFAGSRSPSSPAHSAKWVAQAGHPTPFARQKRGGWS
jgi:hypothetical protein